MFYSITSKNISIYSRKDAYYKELKTVYLFVKYFCY